MIPGVDYFEKHGIPYVVFGEPENTEVPSVSLNNYEVGYNGGRYLIGKRVSENHTAYWRTEISFYTAEG